MLRYDPRLVQHLRAIERRHHSLIRRTIEEQLLHQPDVEARNRKPLLRPADFGATWELRFGPSNRFRVFYRVDSSAREVHILAIEVKEGNRLMISGEEFEL